MNYFNVYSWVDFKTQPKISKSTNRVLLKNFVFKKAVLDKYMYFVHNM